MALKAEYDSIEDVPEAHRELYTEQDGKFHFTGVEGLAGTAAQKRLRDEAGSWRIKHKEANTSLASWTALGESPEKVREILDRVPELEAAAAAGGSKSADAVKVQVEAAKATLQGTLGRQLAETDAKLKSANDRITQYENGERTQAIRDQVIRATSDSKQGVINPEALEDVLMYAERHFEVEEQRDENGRLVITSVRTKDGVGVTPGLEAMAWLSEMQPRKGHWYMPSEGGGATGSRGSKLPGGGNNPWAAATWNLTAQGAFYTEHGPEKAAQMARAAGTELGGPPPKGAASNVKEQRRR